MAETGDWLSRVFDNVPDEPAPEPRQGNIAPLEGGDPDAPGVMGMMDQDARAFVNELFGRDDA